MLVLLPGILPRSWEIQKTDCNHRNDDRCHCRNHGGSGNGPAHFPVIFRSEILGGTRQKTADQAGNESEDQKKQRAGRSADRRQCFFSEKASHHPGVGDHIKLMKNIPDQQGDGEKEQ